MSPLLLNSTLLGIEQQLVRYVYSAWIILGVPGGILNLLIFSRQNMRKNSCCIYFFATSLNNLASLGVGVLPVFYSLNNRDPLSTSIIFCKVRGYFLQISLMISRWFISFACIDRFASSSSSPRLRAFAKTHIAYRCILAIIITWVSIASHRLIFYEVKGTLCAIISNPGAALYHSIYVVFGGGILPTTIMITCAILIRRNLFIKKQRRNQKVKIKFLVDQIKLKDSMDTQVITILYIQIICYIILMTPQMCNVTYSAIVSRIPNRNLNSLAVDRMFAFLAELMMYVFPVLSFYLYTLSSPTFRSELWDIMASVMNLRSNMNKNQIEPSKSSTQINSSSRGLPTTMDKIHNLNEQQSPTVAVISIS